ncbi:MAG: type VI secretion system tube protein Hcp [Gammaproteobacteria bacterium]|nr:type VI secretion system tube protein Hcp [Gammaproteobacteria bacterium]
MAVDMFLKLADVKGESIDDKHAGATDILSWRWGMSQNGSAHLGTGAGAGKVSVKDLVITKYIDKGTPAMVQACCGGTHFKEAVLTVRKAGDTALEYLKIKMTDALIASITTGGEKGDDRLTEEVTLNFAEFKLEYAPQKPDGSGDAAVEAGWNIPKNCKA